MSAEAKVYRPAACSPYGLDMTLIPGGPAGTQLKRSMPAVAQVAEEEARCRGWLAPRRGLT
jgi:hypothetical protein